MKSEERARSIHFRGMEYLPKWFFEYFWIQRIDTRSDFHCLQNQRSGKDLDFITMRNFKKREE